MSASRASPLALACSAHQCLCKRRHHRRNREAVQRLGGDTNCVTAQICLRPRFAGIGRGLEDALRSKWVCAPFRTLTRRKARRPSSVSSMIEITSKSKSVPQKALRQETVGRPTPVRAQHAEEHSVSHILDAKIRTGVSEIWISL